MRLLFVLCGSCLMLVSAWQSAISQEKIEAPAKSISGTAASVNDQAISETAVQRGLKGVPAEQQEEARQLILQQLIDHTLIDQHLQQLRISVETAEIESRMTQVREEIKKAGQAFDKVIQELRLTEAEVRANLAAEVRWQKFVDSQAPEKTLRDFFDQNPEMFDGTMVRARHILMKPPANDAPGLAAAKEKLLLTKRQIEEEAAKTMGKAGVSGDNGAHEKARRQAIEDAFAAAARRESSCPSKEQGGDLNFFPRIGGIVEPFAQAAFALQPHQLSDVVVTPYGCHLLLVTDRRPGKETKFEDVKEIVKDLYGERLRIQLLSQLKPKAQIVVTPPVKP